MHAVPVVVAGWGRGEARSAVHSSEQSPPLRVLNATDLRVVAGVTGQCHRVQRMDRGTTRAASARGGPLWPFRGSRSPGRNGLPEPSSDNAPAELLYGLLPDFISLLPSVYRTSIGRGVRHGRSAGTRAAMSVSVSRRRTGQCGVGKNVTPGREGSELHAHNTLSLYIWGCVGDLGWPRKKLG